MTLLAAMDAACEDITEDVYRCWIRRSKDFLSELQACEGNLLCGVVCRNCFEKCTYRFADIKNDLRTVPKKNCHTFSDKTRHLEKCLDVMWRPLVDIAFKFIYFKMSI